MMQTEEKTMEMSMPMQDSMGNSMNESMDSEMTATPKKMNEMPECAVIGLIKNQLLILILFILVIFRENCIFSLFLFKFVFQLFQLLTFV